MKSFLTLVFLLSGIFYGMCQAKSGKYIELHATLDALSNIYVEPLPGPPANDSSFDYKLINRIISKNNSSIYVINQMAQIGWKLSTSVYIQSDKYGRPNRSFLIYYFEKILR